MAGVVTDRVVTELEAKVDDANVKISTYRRNFEQSMSAIGQSAAQAEVRVAASTSAIGNSALDAGEGIARAAGLIGAGLGLVVSGFAGAAVAAAEYATHLVDLSRQSGLTVEDIQALSRAGREFNVTAEQISRGVEALNRNFGEARSGAATQVGAFRSIGIDQDQLKSYSTVAQLLPAVMDGIQRLGSESERTAAAQRLFNEAGADLVPILEQGSQGYAAMQDAAQRAGIVTTEQAERAAEAEQRLSDLAETIKGNLASALADIVPYVEGAVDALGNLAHNASVAFARLTDLTSVQLPQSWAGSLARAANPSTNATLAAFLAPFLGEDRPDPNTQNAGLITSAIMQGLGGGGQRLGAVSTARPHTPRARHPRADHSAEREAEAARQFNSRLAQLQGDLLAAREVQATSAEEVAQYEIQQVESARDRQDADYRAQAENARTNKDIARARAEQLVQANDAVAAQRISNIQYREQQRRAEEQSKTAEAGLQNEIDLVRSQGDLARTSAARQASAIRLLDLEEQLERLTLEAVRDQSRNADERARAQSRLDALPAIYDARRQAARLDNLSPMAAYWNSIPKTADEINEALERINADGLSDLNDGLGQAAARFLHLGGVAGQVLDRMIADFIRLIAQQAELAAFGGGGGIFGSIFGAIGGAAKGGSGGWIGDPGALLPKFAGGGSMMIGGKPGIDQNVLSLNGSPIARVGMGERLDVVPQGRTLASPGSAMSAHGASTPQQVKLVIQTTEDFEARVTEISGNVAVEVQRAAAPQIIAASKTETIRTLSRPGLNRG